MTPTQQAIFYLGVSFVAGIIFCFVFTIIIIFLRGVLKRRREKKENLIQQIPQQLQNQYISKLPIQQPVLPKLQTQQTQQPIQHIAQNPIQHIVHNISQESNQPTSPLLEPKFQKMERWVTYDEPPKYNTQLFQEVNPNKIKPKLKKKLKGGKN